MAALDPLRRDPDQTPTAGPTGTGRMEFDRVGIGRQPQGVARMAGLAAARMARSHPQTLRSGLDARPVRRRRLGAVVAVGPEPRLQRRVLDFQRRDADRQALQLRHDPRDQLEDGVGTLPTGRVGLGPQCVVVHTIIMPHRTMIRQPTDHPLDCADLYPR